MGSVEAAFSHLLVCDTGKLLKLSVPAVVKGDKHGSTFVVVGRIDPRLGYKLDIKDITGTTGEVRL